MKNLRYLFKNIKTVMKIGFSNRVMSSNQQHEHILWEHLILVNNCKLVTQMFYFIKKYKKWKC